MKGYISDATEIRRVVEKMDIKKNAINPKHYQREEAMECIDEMIMLFGKEAVKKFCLLNAWKYRYRAADKNGIEDLKKSDWYIKKYKELDDSGYIISKKDSDLNFKFMPTKSV